MHLTLNCSLEWGSFLTMFTMLEVFVHFSLQHSLNFAPTYPFAYSLIYPFNYPNADSFIQLFIHAFILSFMSAVYQLCGSFVYYMELPAGLALKTMSWQPASRSCQWKKRPECALLSETGLDPQNAAVAQCATYPRPWQCHHAYQ